MNRQQIARVLVIATIVGAAWTGGVWAQTAPAAPSATAPAVGPGAAGQAPATPGRGQGGRGFGPVQIGPPAPVPAEVAMLRPSAAELAQINQALQKFIDTDKSAARTVLKKYESLLMVQPPRLNTAATFTQTTLRMGPRHEGFVETAKRGNIDLLLDGDSITDWWVQGDENKQMFDKYFGHLKTANFAIAADTTQGVLWGLHNGEGQGFQPKAIMLMIGTNNNGANTAPEIAEGIGAVVLEMRHDFPDAKILLLGIFPRGVPGEPVRDRIAEVNRIIARLDDQRHVFYMDIGSKFLDEKGVFLPNAFRADNLHPQARGYDIWGEAVQAKLAQLMSAGSPIAQNAGGAPAQVAAPAPAAAPPARPTPPTRDPNTPGYVTARELPDGTVPPPDVDGNFIIGPTHTPAPETVAQEGVPKGTISGFTMSSADSRIYPGIARDAGTFGTPDPNDPTNLIVTTSHPAPYTRRVTVYVPQQYVPGTAAPFIVGADGGNAGDQVLFAVLDNLIAQKRVPAMIAISIANGTGDAQGSERGLEYDTMSGVYAEFVETEVLPLVEQQAKVKLTKDPEGRATMGGSSGGSAALIMAWYHPELYHRVLTYSLTAVNQQWPHRADNPGGAWDFHARIIPNSPVKPIRIWMEVGDRDLLNPNVMRDDMHDWVVANENMAKVLAAKGYHYQFVFARNAGHTDGTVKRQTLPEALEWLWKGYPVDGAKSVR